MGGTDRKYLSHGYAVRNERGELTQLISIVKYAPVKKKERSWNALDKDDREITS